jgi:DNA polymerase III subunit beta
MRLVAQCLVGDLVAAVAFAADIIPRKPTIPILANVLLAARDDTLTIEATDLDQRMASRAGAKVTKPGAATVNASTLSRWLRRHDDRAEFAIGANHGRLFAEIGSSRLVLQTLPANDFPAPFDVSATISFRLTESEYRQLFKQTAAIIPATEVRPALCGLFLRCADRKLIGVATEGKRIVEVSIDAPAELAEFSIIIPRDFVLGVAKMEGDITLRVGERFVEVESGNSTITSRLIGAVYPGYRHAFPPPSENTIEVDRAALVDAFELLRAAIGRPAETKKAQPPFASITWSDGAGEVLVAAGEPEIGEVPISATAKGHGSFAVPIAPIVGLLSGIDAERIVLDSAAQMSPIRITKVETDGFIAVQSPVRP